MTGQMDLFGVPAARAPAGPVVVPAPAAAATAGQVEFAQRKIPIWSKRAAELRDRAERGERGAAMRAHGLDYVAARLAREAAGGDDLEALRLSLAACQPFVREGVAFNAGPIMAEVRAGIEAKIARLEQEDADVE